MRSSHSMLIAAALAVGSRGGSCQPVPGPPLSDGGEPESGADAALGLPGDSSSSGGEDAMASADAAPEASDDGPFSDDGGVDAGTGVVLTQNGGEVVSPCGSAPSAQTLTVTNPGSGSVTWNATPADLASPNTSTLAPGASVSVTVSLPGVTGTKIIPITISDGHSNPVATYVDYEYGYDVSWTPANLDFGNVQEQALEQPDANVAPPSTLAVVVTGTYLGAAFPQPAPTGSPCLLFGVAITSQIPSGSAAFSIQAGSANPGGGCSLPIQFAPPFNAPAGTYTATFAFGDSTGVGPLCDGPASFTATAELLAPP